jgi:rare lipoprotein A
MVAPAPTVRPSLPSEVHTGDRETGIASWYGIPFHGRQAANGEIFDMEKMTAAHRTLPFGTMVRVHNLTNGRETDVRIIDRGPFVNGRIIDLSRAAAESIGMIGPGIAQVMLEVVSPPPAPEAELYAVQIGAFADRARADALRQSMGVRFGEAELVLRQAEVTLWRVLVGRVNSSQKAEELARAIRAEGRPALVVRLDQ